MTKWRYVTGERVPVQVRLPRVLVRTLDGRAVDLDCTRSELVERFIRQGLEREMRAPEPTDG